VQPPIFGRSLSKAKYTLSILIASENAKPLKRVVEFTYDPREAKLAVQFDEKLHQSSGAG
jgi:hypothetical protein